MLIKCLSLLSQEKVERIHEFGSVLSVEYE